MVNPQIIIHLGTYKTGSSSIQNTLWTNRNLLRAQSILYPESGLLKSEPEVGFRHSLLVYGYKKNINAWSDKVTQLIKEIKDSKCNKVIISSEAWSLPNQIASLQLLLEKFKAAGFDDFSAICYFRNQEQYALSLYREFTWRRGNKERFAEYVKKNKKLFNYLLLARIFNNTFNNRVKYNIFNEIDDISTHFFESLGIDIEKFSFDQFCTLANRGLSAAEIELFRLLNEEGKSSKKSQLNINYTMNRISQFVNTDMFIEKTNGNIAPINNIWKENIALQTGFNKEQIEKLTAINKKLENKMDIKLLTDIFKTIMNDNTNGKLSLVIPR